MYLAPYSSRIILAHDQATLTGIIAYKRSECGHVWVDETDDDGDEDDELVPEAHDARVRIDRDRVEPGQEVTAGCAKRLKQTRN